MTSPNAFQRSFAFRVGGIARRLLRDNWGILAIVLLWEWWIRADDLDLLVMPHVWLAVGAVVQEPLPFLHNAGLTLLVASGGLACGLLIGTFIAILSWSSRTIAGVFSVAALLVTSVPVIAFVPILGRLLGYGAGTAFTIVALICFFPTFVYTLAGLKRLPPGGGDLIAVLGGGRWAILRHVALFSAIPNWMAALRLAGPSALLAAMAAEYLMGTPGLGGMIHDATSHFDTARAIGASLVAALLSLGVFSLASRGEKVARSRWA